MFNPQTEEESCLPAFSVGASPISERKVLGLPSWKCLLLKVIHFTLSLANLGMDGADFVACETLGKWNKTLVPLFPLADDSPGFWPATEDLVKRRL